MDTDSDSKVSCVLFSIPDNQYFVTINILQTPKSTSYKTAPQKLSINPKNPAILKIKKFIKSSDFQVSSIPNIKLFLKFRNSLDPSIPKNPPCDLIRQSNP